MLKIPYANSTGSIMYCMVCSRPDLAHSISVVDRFMTNPGCEHWNALKRVLSYLKGSVSRGLLFKGNGGADSLVGYVDSDFAWNLDTRKSFSGYVFTLFGTTISWKANLQSVVALSITAAEYISVTEGINEAIWLRGILSELGIHQSKVKYIL